MSTQSKTTHPRQQESQAHEALNCEANIGIVDKLSPLDAVDNARLPLEWYIYQYGSLGVEARLQAGNLPSL